MDDGFAPFASRTAFELAEWAFEISQLSMGKIRHLLSIWAADNITQNTGTLPPFVSAEELFATIDAIPYGEARWFTFTVSYAGELSEDSAGWKRQTYEVHTRDAWTVLKNMLATREFHGKFDYTAYEHYSSPNNRMYDNFMSGIWANRESVRTIISGSPVYY
jgi:hypothetical protein